MHEGARAEVKRERVQVGERLAGEMRATADAAIPDRTGADFAVTKFVSARKNLLVAGRVVVASRFFGELLAEPHHKITEGALRQIALKINEGSGDDPELQGQMLGALNVAHREALESLGTFKNFLAGYGFGKEGQAINKKAELLEHIILIPEYRAELMGSKISIASIEPRDEPESGAARSSLGLGEEIYVSESLSRLAKGEAQKQLHDLHHLDRDLTEKEGLQEAQLQAHLLRLQEAELTQEGRHAELDEKGPADDALAGALPYGSYVMIDPKPDGNCWLRATTIIAADHLAHDEAARDAVLEKLPNLVGSFETMVRELRETRESGGEGAKLHSAAKYTEKDVVDSAHAFEGFILDAKGHPRETIQEMMGDAERMRPVYLFLRFVAMHEAREQRDTRMGYGMEEAGDFEKLTFPVQEGSDFNVATLATFWGMRMPFVTERESVYHPSSLQFNDDLFGFAQQREGTGLVNDTPDNEQMWIVLKGGHMQVAIPA